uniref:glycosyltransferase family 2 protein n=1 Tax=Algoriphagus sp. TaxID=1872435 RepID=UPI00404836ED
METPKLSICIATFNRGKFIGDTLESIVTQIPKEVEIIVVDGNSSDNSEEMISRYVENYSNLRYYREITNSGVDQDYDKSVSYATGEFCWLMTDDDLLIDNSINKILSLIDMKYDLIIVNSEIWNADFTTNLHTKMLKSSSDKIYQPADENNLFREVATCLSFIGSVIIRKSVWMERDRMSYYGSLFGHVGTIFQKKLAGDVYVIAAPVLKIRYGNGMWTPRSFEIWYFKWPNLVWSFERFSDNTKEMVVRREPWRYYFGLLKSKAFGDYTNDEFKKFISCKNVDLDYLVAFVISILPGIFVNFILVVIYSIIRRSAKYTLFDLLRSKHSSFLSKGFAKIVRINLV